MEFHHISITLTTKAMTVVMSQKLPAVVAEPEVETDLVIEREIPAGEEERKVDENEREREVVEDEQEREVVANNEKEREVADEEREGGIETERLDRLARSRKEERGASIKRTRTSARKHIVSRVQLPKTGDKIAYKEGEEWKKATVEGRGCKASSKTYPNYFNVRRAGEEAEWITSIRLSGGLKIRRQWKKSRRKKRQTWL